MIFTLLSLKANSQDNKQSAFSFNYNYQLPVGDLANTYGNNSAVGASYFLEKNNNIILGLEANYIFGNNINDEGIFKNITTSSGAIIDGDGRYANVNLMQRGFDAYLSQGFGYLQHQIFIDTKNQNIPQLSEEMKEGYDRLSSGFSMKSSIDYKYYHEKGRLQISAGINYTIAYTKNQRSYDFAKNQPYPNTRKWDKLLGFKVEIIIPINRQNDEQFHYF